VGDGKKRIDYDVSMGDALQTLHKAVAEHQAGRVAEAEKLYKRVLNSDPNNVEALRLLGVLASQVGRHDVAAQLVGKAISLRPTWGEAWGDMGVAYAGLGKINEAKGAYEKALALKPKMAGVKSNLAELLKRMGRPDEAMALYKEATELEPNLPEPWYNMGGMLFSQGKVAEAEACFKKSIEIRPNYAPAYNNLGVVWWSQGKKREAGEAFAKAVEVNPAYAEAWNNFGQVWQDQGRSDEAMECYRRALAHRPDYADAHCTYGLALEKKGDRAAAIREWQEALRLRPGWEDPQYYLAAAGAASAPVTAPPSYVARLFDDYSDKFDEHLSGTLEYRAPQLLFDAMIRVGVEHFALVMDIGCGTGLAGEKFRPMTGRMIGVDLAAQMIQRAKQRGIYDELIVGEAVAELRKRKGEFDLLLAADVLGYVGELSGLFAAAGGAMKQGGYFALSVEKLQGEDFKLLESRRFAHSLAYVQRMAREAGMEIVQVSDEVLRLEARKPIEGMILVVRKK
jgi:predicted TPR repeat methyltransferase